MQVLNSPCFEQGCDQESNERFDDRSVKEHQMNALDRKVPLLSAQVNRPRLYGQHKKEACKG